MCKISADDTSPFSKVLDLYKSEEASKLSYFLL